MDAGLRCRAWSDSVSRVPKTNHYNDGSDNPAWIAENDYGTSWTRNIGGLGGGLALTVDQAGAKTWQLTNLHGDTIATVPDGGTPTYQEADEFGNLRDNTPRWYGWLGSAQRSGDALGGVVLMGVRLYSPVLGRFLQTDPVRGGSANAYDYANQDPINQFDLDGKEVKKCGWRCNAVLGLLMVGIWAACMGVVKLKNFCSGLTGGLVLAAKYVWTHTGKDRKNSDTIDAFVTGFVSGWAIGSGRFAVNGMGKDLLGKIASRKGNKKEVIEFVRGLL